MNCNKVKAGKTYYSMYNPYSGVLVCNYEDEERELFEFIIFTMDSEKDRLRRTIENGTKLKMSYLDIERMLTDNFFESAYYKTLRR